MAYLPRGIAPELLLAQVKNTMPYLFGSEIQEAPLGRFVPASVLRDYETQAGQPLSHFEYFRLCLSSHYLTCGTPVPTDVDNQIRHKLWPAHLPLEIALQMAQLVLESRQWDFTLVSSRSTWGASESPWQKEVLTGHLGEWFTLSSAAYCALKQYKDPLAQEKCQELFDQIADEVRRHSEIFGSLWRANEGLACLKAAASVAHNFGDLDRVMDMWDLSVGDPLRLEFYKLAAVPFDSNRKLRYLGRLWVAGELYKANIGGSSMAFENHRHFALRKPKCLRQSSDLLVPTGPFFDDWGRRVARTFAGSQGEPTEKTLEVVDALSHGWDRLPKTVGYGRALRGILEIHTDLPRENLNSKHAFNSTLEVSQEQFEKKWNDEALLQMDDIPSRA
jgi:hypothetical protein